MEHDLGCIEFERRTLQPLGKPFDSKGVADVTVQTSSGSCAAVL